MNYKKNKNNWKKLAVFSFFVVLIIALLVIVPYTLPNEVYINNDNDQLFPGLKLQNASENYIKASANTNGVKADLSLFGLLPIKTVDVYLMPDVKVIPSGKTFGVKLISDGVMVVGMSDVECDGKLINPSVKSGLQIKDIILKVDNKIINTQEDLAAVIEKCGGKKVKLNILRNNKPMEIYIIPVKSDYDGKYKIGTWVRDSTAGIGTMTFYEEKTGYFAGLGHAINDVDTGILIPIKKGVAFNTQITDVIKGIKGKSGELKGIFLEDEKIGSLIFNDDTGVFGILDNPNKENKEYSLAPVQEIKEGKATILCNIDGEEVKEYEIMIERIFLSGENSNKNLVLKITDKELLEKTGGIVQGMSGSPIIQNGKIIGAVTHVFINDPTKGYGIFVQNMFDTLNDLFNNKENAA